MAVTGGSLVRGTRVDRRERSGRTIAVGRRDQRRRAMVVVAQLQVPGELLRLARGARERRVAGDLLAVGCHGAGELHHGGRAGVDPRALVLLRRVVEAPRLLPLDRLAELDGRLVELHEAPAEDHLAVRGALELLRRTAGERERGDDGPVAGELAEARVFGTGRGARVLEARARRQQRGGGEQREQCEGTDHGDSWGREWDHCWKYFAARSRICVGVRSSSLWPIDQRWPNGSTSCP